MAGKKYRGDTTDMEKKLARVMERLGVTEYQCDWVQNRAGCRCWVEMRYGGTTYRFENSAAKSAECGRNLVYLSDLMASVVYSLEGLARAVEQGIFTLDMLLVGVPALPEPARMEPCFRAMGFVSRPTSVDQVKDQYRYLAKMAHPDHGGTDQAFKELTQNYNDCLNALKNGAGDTYGREV